MNGAAFVGSKVVDDILDTAHPPVARFRLLSTGLAQNHMLPATEDISGQSACLACGNCVDACPVIAGDPPEDLVARTSMALEHVVAEQCRRCYKCVASCPQIDRPVKDYVRSFRRVERIVHFLLMFSVVFLAITGITIYHFRPEMPDSYYFTLGLIHRALALVLLSAPLVFVLGDRRHWRRALSKTLQWTRADLDWLVGAMSWVASRGREGRLMRGDFNTGQKAWYTFLMLAIPLFAISGIIQWIGADVLPKGFVDGTVLFHSNLALVSDILLTIHVCVKIVYPYTRDARRGIAASLVFSKLRESSEGRYEVARAR